MISQSDILDQIRLHKNKLTELGIKEVGVFGSYARNQQSEVSDIDFLVEFQPDYEDFDHYMAICDFLEGLFKGKKVEVVTKSGLSPHIGPKILKEVIYA